METKIVNNKEREALLSLVKLNKVGDDQERIVNGTLPSTMVELLTAVIDGDADRVTDLAGEIGGDDGDDIGEVANIIKSWRWEQMVTTVPIVNLTGHPVVVENDDGRFVFPSQGKVIVTSEVDSEVTIGGFSMKRANWGETVGLPSPIDGVWFIVSAITINQNPGRTDLIRPDTGQTAKREGGKIKSVRGFVWG